MMFWRPRGLPWESETERFLALRLRWANPAVRWFSQVEVATEHGVFWLDAAGQVAPERAIAFECDGPHWHGDRLRDFCRDALIVGTGRIAAVYRLSSWEILTRLPACLAAIARHEPGLVATAKRALIEDLARADLSRHGLCNPPAPTVTHAGGNSVEEFQAFAAACRGLRFQPLVEEFRRCRN